MRIAALVSFAFLISAPAAAQDLSLPDPAERILLAQVHGPHVIPNDVEPAPRHRADAPRAQRRVRQQRPRHHTYRELIDEAEDRPYRHAAPHHAPRHRPQHQPHHEPAPRSDLGGGFIEFLMTGRTAPRTHYAPHQDQPAHYGPRGDLPQRQPLHVSRTDPTEQPEAKPIFDPRYQRTDVEFDTEHPVGTIVIDTRKRFLYLVQPNGRALRYGVGVGRPGFEWKGVKTVSAKKEWPDWRPPKEMRQRQPWLPVFMAGGPQNPLGARALYLGSSLYRIHGSNEPHTIGSAVSSGCFRMRNQDVIDLYNRVTVGARVVVL
jgi:lipoprotein-anchoring transpeptidase ErfK/SrfK